MNLLDLIHTIPLSDENIAVGEQWMIKYHDTIYGPVSSESVHGFVSKLDEHDWEGELAFIWAQNLDDENEQWQQLLSIPEFDRRIEQELIDSASDRRKLQQMKTPAFNSDEISTLPENQKSNQELGDLATLFPGKWVKESKDSEKNNKTLAKKIDPKQPANHKEKKTLQSYFHRFKYPVFALLICLIFFGTLNSFHHFYDYPEITWEKSKSPTGTKDITLEEPKTVNKPKKKNAPQRNIATTKKSKAKNIRDKINKTKKIIRKDQVKDVYDDRAKLRDEESERHSHYEEGESDNPYDYEMDEEEYPYADTYEADDIARDIAGQLENDDMDDRDYQKLQDQIKDQVDDLREAEFYQELEEDY